MAFTRLRLPTMRRSSPRRVERADIDAALTRVTRTLWGDAVPVRSRGIRRDVLSLQTPSAPWRAELLWSQDRLLRALAEELPYLRCPWRVSVSFGPGS